MSIQTVNLSANEVLEHLNIKLPAGWTHEANEIDTVCYDHSGFALGFIVTLNINDGAYSFTVHEFCEAKEYGNELEQTEECKTYEQALSYIRDRVSVFMNPMAYLAENF